MVYWISLVDLKQPSLLLPLRVLMYLARSSFLLCYAESPAGFALVCECYLFYSLLNGWWTKRSVWTWTIWDCLILRGCLRFSLPSPVCTFERSLTTRKWWDSANKGQDERKPKGCPDLNLTNCGNCSDRVGARKTLLPSPNSIQAWAASLLNSLSMISFCT
jgi:hypothetical protein